MYSHIATAAPAHIERARRFVDELVPVQNVAGTARDVIER
jgi:hypothetical protein